MGGDMPAWAESILLGLLGVLMYAAWKDVHKRIDKEGESRKAEFAALAGRVTKCEDNKADKDFVASLQRQMSDHRQETRESFDRVFDRLDTIVDRLK